MSGNPGSSRIEGAEDPSESDADMESSSSEEYKSPSPLPKPVRKALKALTSKPPKSPYQPKGKRPPFNSFQFSYLYSTYCVCKHSGKETTGPGLSNKSWGP